MELKVNEKARKRAMHTIVSAAVMVLFLFTSIFLIAVSVFTAASSAFMYILFGGCSLCFGLLMAYVMEDTPKPGHITEAGMLLILPALFLINLVIPLVNKFYERISSVASMSAERGDIGGVGVVSLFNQNLPDPIATSIITFIFFNLPLVYLLIRRDDKKELWWYLLAPVILIVFIYGVNYIVNSSL